MTPNHWEVWTPHSSEQYAESLGDFADRTEALRRVEQALVEGATSVTINVAGFDVPPQ